MRTFSTASLEQAIDANSGALVSIHCLSKRTCVALYSCPDCAASVIPVRGFSNRWHFRHYKASECSHSVSETPLHQQAKAIIAEAAKITVPSDGPVEPARCLSIQSCELEKSAGGLRYDALIQTEIGPIAVEVCVTHRVDEHKASKLAAIQISCFEITLSPNGHSATQRDWVLHTAPREWVHESLPEIDTSTRNEDGKPCRKPPYEIDAAPSNDDRAPRRKPGPPQVYGGSIGELIDAWRAILAPCTEWLDRTVVSRGGSPIACPSMDNFDRACLETHCKNEIENLTGLAGVGERDLKGLNAIAARAKLRRAQREQRRILPAG